MLANDLYYDRFEPPGVSYKGKLIGVETVQEARGDKMCQEAMNKLKAMVKVTGEHKQRIILNISTAGVRVLDEKTMREEYLHEVQKISFVSRDPTDGRAFGLVAGDEGSHKFFAIKTEKAAYNVVLALKELFESVLKAKKRQMEEYQGNKMAVDNTYSVPEVKPRPEPEQPQQTPAAEPEEEDPSSLYAVPNKKKLDDYESREQSLAELARTVETMQEGLHNMEEFSIAPLPPPSARRTSREPLSPTPEVSLEQPFNLSAPPPTRPPPPVPSDPFQSQLMEDQFSSPPQQQQSSASEDLFKEFGDTLGSPLKVQQPQQVPSANPFGPPMGSTMNFNSGFGAPMTQQGFGMQQQQQFAPQRAMQDPFGPPAMGSTNNDLFGGNVLQPASVAPPPGQAAASQKSDPFADLGSLGGGGSGDKKNNKDMFAGFKMAKPGEVGVPNMMGQQKQNDNPFGGNTGSKQLTTSTGIPLILDDDPFSL